MINNNDNHNKTNEFRFINVWIVEMMTNFSKENKIEEIKRNGTKMKYALHRKVASIRFTNEILLIKCFILIYFL